LSRPLEAADAYCRHLARRHYENFTVASGLLREPLRRDLARIYAYCRTTDDLGDESGTDARRRLARWREEVLDLFEGRLPAHPVLIALGETIARCGLPARPFLDLIQANVQDQEVTSYAAWAELRAYCMLSAAPVGRLVLGVFRIGGLSAERWSDDVCIGLQLANFAQDVSVDARKGRTYLLQTELRAAPGARGVAAATRAHCERAQTLLASGRSLEALAPWPLRFQLALYRLGGLAIVRAIARLGYRTDLHRPRVSAAAKVVLLAHAVEQSFQRSRDARALETA
jgi:squalene synthase HpnC